MSPFLAQDAWNRAVKPLESRHVCGRVVVLNEMGQERWDETGRGREMERTWDQEQYGCDVSIKSIRRNVRSLNRRE